MEIVFLGTGGGRFVLVKQLRWTGGFRINSPSANIHVDPGPGALTHSHSLKQDPLKLDAIIVTHYHIDHCSDAAVLIEGMTDYAIISNVDPYEDDPKQILEDIAVSSEKFGKIRDQNLFVIEDRRLGIRKALSLAKANDVVLITGKGAEQSIVIGGKRSSWDDRKVVREELKLITTHD